MIAQTLDTAERETLRYGYGDTVLGTVVVAESMRGIAALFIGDDRPKLLRDLRGVFPEVEFVIDPTGLAQTIAKTRLAQTGRHGATPWLSTASAGRVQVLQLPAATSYPGAEDGRILPPGASCQPMARAYGQGRALPA